MRTLYYVKAGANWFAFYLDQGALALANGAPDSLRLVGVLASAGEHDFDFVATASQKDPLASRLRWVGTEVEYERD